MILLFFLFALNIQESAQLLQNTLFLSSSFNHKQEKKNTVLLFDFDDGASQKIEITPHSILLKEKEIFSQCKKTDWRPYYDQRPIRFSSFLELQCDSQQMRIILPNLHEPASKKVLLPQELWDKRPVKNNKNSLRYLHFSHKAPQNLNQKTRAKGPVYGHRFHPAQSRGLLWRGKDPVQENYVNYICQRDLFLFAKEKSNIYCH